MTADPRAVEIVADAFGKATGDTPDWWAKEAAAAVAALADAGLLLPPDALQRTEHDRVYQDGHRIPLNAVRTVWETPWLPERIAEWERELLEREAAILHTDQQGDDSGSSSR